MPIDDVLDAEGRYGDTAALQAVFADLDLADDAPVITCCTVGGRACTAWFALTHLLGRGNVAVYDGSWAEWGRTPTAPVATGRQPRTPRPAGRIRIGPHRAVRNESKTMSQLIRKSLNTPEEDRPFEQNSGHLEVVNLDAGAVGRATFEPGWRWSDHVKPIAGTGSCQAAHLGYFISGRMTVEMDDGERMDYGPGDFAVMAPGHDAWVVGDEPCVFLDWQGYTDYAKRR